jgi:hypothetical protein
MGLGKYRPLQDEFHDEGYEVTVPADFVPDFYNRNLQFKYGTCMSSVASVEVRKWKGVTFKMKLAWDYYCQ